MKKNNLSLVFIIAFTSFNVHAAPAATPSLGKQLSDFISNNANAIQNWSTQKKVVIGLLTAGTLYTLYKLATWQPKETKTDLAILLDDMETFPEAQSVSHEEALAQEEINQYNMMQSVAISSYVDDVMRAIDTNDMEKLKECIEQGNIHTIKDREGLTALNYAVFSGNVEAVALLLNTGMNPNNPDNSDVTPLFDAIFANSHAKEMVDLFIMAGADVNHKSCKLGCTPLMIAAFKGDAELVNQLLQAGADADIADKQGNTAVVIAENNGHTNVVEVFLNYSQENYASLNVL